MTKQAYTVHVAETRHFEFEVWAEDQGAAERMAAEVWAKANTVGQWELPDTDTDYQVTKTTS